MILSPKDVYDIVEAHIKILKENINKWIDEQIKISENYKYEDPKYYLRKLKKELNNGEFDEE